ncbi:peritrophic matrix protein 1-A precursor [Tribolium castaneum]|uniref:Peritrophic matrix protein 1-A n=1 Tax=Tribolium castaneum TaxID=7070 RepID=D1MAI8_TRICA|nr:peritrophic matrix protein 1-A precursor [Tribolium castaneum]ACY95479.1 peritrophic matrix protein 1-A [Tribolium castaneum]|eukprot:NP_001161928.1 peritrophic matrix protein 1-A precursor [Tribolium castaneum]
MKAVITLALLFHITVVTPRATIGDDITKHNNNNNNTIDNNNTYNNHSTYNNNNTINNNNTYNNNNTINNNNTYNNHNTYNNNNNTYNNHNTINNNDPCTPDPKPDPRCIDDSTELWPHPADCAKYIECFHGNSYEMTCPPGLYFSSSSKTCVTADESECCKTSSQC